MEEIKVNDYIRTKDGIIGKVIQKEHNVINDEDFYRIQVSSDYTTLVTLEKLYKHSSNIIDLIEVDDVGIMNCYGLLVKKFITKEDILELKLGNYTLLKIVTKEQFANVEYRLED